MRRLLDIYALLMQIDVFSFGILLWEMLTGQLPWGELSSPMQAGRTPIHHAVHFTSWRMHTRRHCGL